MSYPGFLPLLFYANGNPISASCFVVLTFLDSSMRTLRRSPPCSLRNIVPFYSTRFELVNSSIFFSLLFIRYCVKGS